MNENDKKLDREEYITQLVERLTKWSDQILSYDPALMNGDRQDLMYTEDGMLLWRTNMIRQLPEFDMYQIKTILEKRYESKQFNPYMGQLSQSNSSPNSNEEEGNRTLIIPGNAAGPDAIQHGNE